jgi:hypothetical protein
MAEAVNFLRDCVIRAREGDAIGYGTFEPMVIGEHARYGLTRESSILQSPILPSSSPFVQGEP